MLARYSTPMIHRVHRVYEATWDDRDMGPTEVEEASLHDLDYLNEEETLYNDASRLAGYNINNVARTHRLLKRSNVSVDKKDDMLLKVNLELVSPRRENK